MFTDQLLLTTRKLLPDVYADQVLPCILMFQEEEKHVFWCENNQFSNIGELIQID